MMVLRAWKWRQFCKLWNKEDSLLFEVEKLIAGNIFATNPRMNVSIPRIGISKEISLYPRRWRATKRAYEAQKIEDIAVERTHNASLKRERDCARATRTFIPRNYNQDVILRPGKAEHNANMNCERIIIVLHSHPRASDEVFLSTFDIESKCTTYNAYIIYRPA